MKKNDKPAFAIGFGAVIRQLRNATSRRSSGPKFLLARKTFTAAKADERGETQ